MFVRLGFISYFYLFILSRWIKLSDECMWYRELTCWYRGNCDNCDTDKNLNRGRCNCSVGSNESVCAIFVRLLIYCIDVSYLKNRRNSLGLFAYNLFEFLHNKQQHNIKKKIQTRYYHKLLVSLYSVMNLCQRHGVIAKSAFSYQKCEFCTSTSTF